MVFAKGSKGSFWFPRELLLVFFISFNFDIGFIMKKKTATAIERNAITEFMKAPIKKLLPFIA